MRKTLSPLLAQNDTYATPPGTRLTPWLRILPATYAYYLLMMRVVLSSSWKARRGRYGDDAWALSSRQIMDALEAAGCVVSIEGMDALHAVDGPVVLVGNHVSTAEAFLLPCIISPVKRCTFVVKPALMTYPVFGPIMRSRDPIVVTRDNPRQDLSIVLERGMQKLGEGLSIVLFPQTTRSVEFHEEKFNSLGVKLAARAGVPVIPIAVKTDGWGNGRWIKEFGRIDPSRPLRFAFGTPMTVEGKGKAEHRAVVDFIKRKLSSW